MRAKRKTSLYLNNTCFICFSLGGYIGEKKMGGVKTEKACGKEKEMEGGSSTWVRQQVFTWIQIRDTGVALNFA